MEKPISELEEKKKKKWQSNHHQLPTPKPFKKVFIFITILCFISYILGTYNNNNNNNPLPNKDPPCLSLIQFNLTTLKHSPPPPPQFNLTTLKHSPPPPPPPSPPFLDFQPHHTLSSPLQESSKKYFNFCTENFTNYCPCQDSFRETQFSLDRFFNRERHCPDSNETIRCLIPIPVGYRSPFPWPKSRDYAWFDNVPFPKLTVFKKSQNWVRLEGDRLVFPGGGTSFRMGAKSYIDDIMRIVPLKSGNIRTVLDVGCGVASFSAALMDYNILTMSVAPRDIHEAQVQFALERGLPAMLDILSTYRLPFPSRSFDMVHCSRCLVEWTYYDGLYMMEIDRVLSPGGYWVLSGPPISWKVSYKGWEVRQQVLEKQQISLENLARRLCWKKIAERGRIAVWRKPTNHIHCIQKSKKWKSPRFCGNTDPDAGWYKKMDPCITPLPNANDIHATSGGALEKWPKRLFTVPPRIRSGTIEGTNAKAFDDDNRLWKRRVSYYGSVLKFLPEGKYRNIMDMNAGLGGFAAAVSKYSVWVMNVVPFEGKNNTLGVVYERGLIGTYMNWCEAFSTYPRTYDLIHAHGVFSMYMNKCNILDILFEMYRIVRPNGALIIRDHVDIIVKVKGITDRMRWNGQILHSEKGPFHPEKILFVDKS